MRPARADLIDMLTGRIADEPKRHHECAQCDAGQHEYARTGDEFGGVGRSKTCRCCGARRS